MLLASEEVTVGEEVDAVAGNESLLVALTLAVELVAPLCVGTVEAVAVPDPLAVTAADVEAATLTDTVSDVDAATLPEAVAVSDADEASDASHSGWYSQRLKMGQSDSVTKTATRLR